MHARRALSKWERGACLMEGSTRGGEVCGLLTSSLVDVLFLALGGENSPVRRPRGATSRKRARGRSRNRKGRGSGRCRRAPLRRACVDAGA
eukprot:5983618-Pleurochrysis_carterae.AAC.1